MNADEIAAIALDAAEAHGIRPEDVVKAIRRHPAYPLGELMQMMEDMQKQEPLPDPVMILHPQQWADLEAYSGSGRLRMLRCGRQSHARTNHAIVSALALAGFGG